jgi:hypothetical protein
VTIEAADGEVSTDRARKVIQMSLDLLKLIVGKERGAGIRQAYDHALPTQTASLVSAEGKGFAPSWGSRSHDAILNEDWYEMISKSNAWRIGESVLQSYSNAWEEPREPYQRFLDALRWHGEGISDPEPHSRLVKYWTAIERMVSLRSNDNVTRKAALLSCRDAQDFPDQFQKCQRLHGKRSAVVHGSASRGVEESEAIASEVENLSKGIICSFLSLLRNLEATGQCDRKALEAEFQLLDEKLSKVPT